MKSKFITVLQTLALLLCTSYSTLSAQKYNWDIPPYAEDYTFITNDGAWCWFSDPRAIYVDNKMFGGFVDKEGSIWAFSYDPATQKREQYKLSDKFNYDDHANPSVMALPDKRVAIFFSAHGGTKVASNDLKSWKKPTTIVVNDTVFGESGRPYMKVTSNQKDKIFIAFTECI